MLGDRDAAHACWRQRRPDVPVRNGLRRGRRRHHSTRRTARVHHRPAVDDLRVGGQTRRRQMQSPLLLVALFPLTSGIFARLTGRSFRVAALLMLLATLILLWLG